MSDKPQSLSDKDLYQRCKEYGMNARMWMRKFAGLLSEVYRRRLYKKEGFYSIHHFAKVLAGMNESTVDRILHLANRLKDKPKLLEQLESGKQSWSKLQAVAFVAKPETDKFWAEKTTALPLHTLEAYVTEFRKESRFILEDESKNNSETREGIKPWETMTFSVSQELERKLLLLKQKIEKERKMPMNWNDALLVMVNELEKKTVKNIKSTKIIKICPECTVKKENEDSAPGEWKVREEPEWWDLKNIVDRRVAGFRKEPIIA